MRQVCLKHHISLGTSFVEGNTNVVLDAVLHNQWPKPKSLFLHINTISFRFYLTYYTHFEMSQPKSRLVNHFPNLLVSNFGKHVWTVASVSCSYERHPMCSSAAVGLTCCALCIFDNHFPKIKQGHWAFLLECEPPYWWEVTKQWLWTITRRSSAIDPCIIIHAFK